MTECSKHQHVLITSASGHLTSTGGCLNTNWYGCVRLESGPHSHQKITKMVCIYTGMWLHCHYKLSWCVQICLCSIKPCPFVITRKLCGCNDTHQDIFFFWGCSVCHKYLQITGPVPVQNNRPTDLKADLKIASTFFYTSDEIYHIFLSSVSMAFIA